MSLNRSKDAVVTPNLNQGRCPISTATIEATLPFAGPGWHHLSWTLVLSILPYLISASQVGLNPSRVVEQILKRRSCPIYSDFIQNRDVKDSVFRWFCCHVSAFLWCNSVSVSFLHWHLSKRLTGLFPEFSPLYPVQTRATGPWKSHWKTNLLWCLLWNLVLFRLTLNSRHLKPMQMV